MRHCITGIAALLFGLATADSQAAPHGGHNHAHNSGHKNGHHHAHNHHGHHHHGHHHHIGRGHRWHHRSWDPRYRTYLYYDSGTAGWFYWCAPDAVYYPVTYVPYGQYVWTGQEGEAVP